MNETNSGKSACCNCSLTALSWVVGVLGTFAVLGALAYYSARRDPAPAVESQRDAQRYQARRELESAKAIELNAFAIDGTKENRAQLSVTRAMELLLNEWKDDNAAGRAKLLERLEASKKAASFE